MGDYTTAHCHLLLGNPTTNIEYINGATMSDDLSKYEALQRRVHGTGDVLECVAAITELVAMVREANRMLDSSGAELYAAKSDYEQMRERAEAAERERDDARDLTWFWQIVDRNGLADVCSDERGALAELARAHRELAELKRKMREPDNELIVLMVDTYFSSRPDTEDDEDFRAVWLAGVNHLLGDKE